MKRSMDGGFLLLVAGLLAVPRVSEGQMLHVADLTSRQISSLDRARTVVLLPAGILEEHGPYLPSYSDGYLNEWLTERLAEAIVARPGWTALIFPAIPLGNSGANDIGGKYTFPGTYTVRFETLRAVFMDLADELGAQGFRWIFVIHLHGAPNHSRALDQAGDYFHDSYAGWMVHLAGLNSVFAAIAGPKGDAETAEDGLPIHAGMDETSWMLFLRPDLVKPEFRQAPRASASNMEDLVAVARARNWPGYLGSPRLATVAHGAGVVHAVTSKAITAAMSILDGADPRTLERYATTMEKSPPDMALDAASRRAETERELRQRLWIEKRAHP